ncbi:hypothetical protein TW95_gp0009 [Pandoravirus inopinatum]|uniref:Uncharacterized protein n=1 Tax=Pandoravirus inopinatum TaxID=1605721 RepID=A0A0B5IVR5_9VIRU|nr:hypothetical protein TW95_gp0009 [Pandoravirus inopinatum]AJF96743.1 hypothetical protein [Pandoravirus inopinatum]
MHFDLGVAHLTHPDGHPCPWPLPVDTGHSDAVASFAYLPSLALEEVFWHHLVGEAIGAAAAAMADEKNKDDDVTCTEALCAWLAAAYTPLRGSPEFCRVARRLLAAWPEIADVRLGACDLSWRGVSRASRSGGGSVTYVGGMRWAGKTTIAVRIGRILARRVKHVVCVVAVDGCIDRMFASLGIAEYEAARTDSGHGYDVFNVDRMWEAVGPLVRAYAREGVLVLVDDLYWNTEQGAPLIDEIANMGVHLVVTSQAGALCKDLCPDRLIWMCTRVGSWASHAIGSFSCMSRTDRDRMVAMHDAHMRDYSARPALVAQRRLDDTWDLQIMPYEPTPVPPPM